MIILYGDYKDLDRVDYADAFSHKEQGEKDGQMRLSWEAFVSPGCKLEERRPSVQEAEEFVWINVRNNVFEKNEYTSYALLPPGEGKKVVMEKTQEKDVRSFICADSRFIVTESECIRAGGKAPASLAELKERELEWFYSLASREAEKDVRGLTAEEMEQAVKCGVFQILHEEVEGGDEEQKAFIAPAAADYARRLMDDMRVWEEKTSQRWFHTTKVSC